MPKVHKVEKARKPNAVVTQEDIDKHTEANPTASYYHWTTRPGGRGKGIKHYSKTYPKASQLTSSPFLSQLYSLKENDFDCCSTAEELNDKIEEIRSELEDMRDEVGTSLDNMPENLRESSSSGEMLQSRYDCLEEAINELDGIQSEIDLDEESESEMDEALPDLISRSNDALQNIEG